MSPQNKNAIIRQDELTKIVNDALQNPTLVKALQCFQISQNEYYRALSGSMRVTTVSSNTSNPGNLNASMDRH
jgi:hypothetical protein